VNALKRYRFLFCIPTTQLSGGVKTVFEVSDRLVELGHDVQLFSYAGPPQWYSTRAPLVAAKDFERIDFSRYDFVVVSNAMLIPIVLPLAGSARCVFLAQDYESFHHSLGPNYDDFLAESPTFVELYRLPVPIIATSRPIARLIEERVGRVAYYMPLGVNKPVFHEQPRSARKGPKRVLFVGNYLMPYKGMRDGLNALEMLSSEMDMQLVIITQEERERRLFAEYSFPVELHFCPSEQQVPPIYASCDVYCCTSWYEGLGLPAIEAFLCGTPVVSTQTLGVMEYAEDGVNLLLAKPNAPDDLVNKLRQVLTDPNLAQSLRAGGFRTAAGRFEWNDSLRHFVNAIEDIDATYSGPGPLDNAALTGLLDSLERDGNLTPIAVFRRFQELAEQAGEVFSALRGSGRATRHDLSVLETVRDELRQYLGNERAQYYPAVKSKFDLCQLILTLAGSLDTERHIPLVLSRNGKNSIAANAASLTEVRYPLA
jgi:glycosyltransferase involved in cell wall biosynthesis